MKDRTVSTGPFSIRFERTRDYELVAAIMTHPRIYGHISDDFYPPPDDFWPRMDEKIFHLLVYLDDKCVGLYITYAINPLLWQVEHCLLPWAWRARATDAIGEAFEQWLWTHTTAEKAIGLTPSCNTLALRYAKRLGMREAGRIEGAYQREFKRHDIVIFEKARAS